MQATVALPADSLKALLDAVFVGAVTVYTSDSAFGEATRVFTSPSEALVHFEDKSYAGYAVHYVDAGGRIEDRRVELDPSKCNGHTFRYSVGGWGLIHIQLKRQATTLECRVAVNTSKRAARWFSTHPELGDPALWRWPVVEKHARRLIRHLKVAAQQRAPAARPGAVRSDRG